MDVNLIWTTAQEAVRALGRHYYPEMEQVAVTVDAGEWIILLLPALMFDPAPISADRLRRRAPYTSPQAYDQRLALVAEHGYLIPVVEHEYRLTEAGTQLGRRLLQAAYSRMATLQPLPSTELERLVGLLCHLVETCLVASEPLEKWSLIHSRRIDPGGDASALVRIDQYVSDLAAFRDDAHLAAWQPYDIEGYAWEAFTFVWRGEATTADELAQKLVRREYASQVYQCALDELVQRGWVTGESGPYRVTEAGAEVRQAAEEATDRYFFAPWSSLSQAELEQMGDLLTRLRDGL